jgi:predicted RNA-binding protein YlxR (DUF448 family)
MPGGHVPIRMCVICRRRFAKSELLRCVDSSGAGSGVEIDGTRPGRGWYVCSDPECRRKFLRTGRLGRKRKGG